MIGSWLPLVIDAIIAGLLVATIAFAIKLNRRLASLREDRAELLELIRQFDQAANRAQDSVGRMKAFGDETGMALRNSVDKAQALRDDLAFIIERGDAIAEKSSRVVEGPKAGGKPTFGAVGPTLNGDSMVGSKAERDLMKAIELAREGH